MSCQSLAARAFESDKDGMTHCGGLHRSVRFSSESRGSMRDKSDVEGKRETTGTICLTELSPVTMSQSAPTSSVAFDLAHMPAPAVPCRFPKLEDCAHFHYERVSLGGLTVEAAPCEDGDHEPGEGWITLKVRSHVNATVEPDRSDRPLTTSWTEASDVREWTLARSADNFRRLDETLHRCIYDRKVSGLPNLTEKITPSLLRDENEYKSLIADYVHHLSIIADDSINCGPVLNWLQMDNKGHKLLVANEDSSSINTPAVAAAYSVRKYVSQARDEISFEVGDMISIIDMPGPSESLWWRGKRGFRVGFFPHHCVAVIGDKVPRHMTQPPPIVGSVAVAPIKPVLRKHGKLISLFRSFILSRPSRRSLKQQGILRERVFGCDLGEHLLNCGHTVPLVLVECARAIEQRGAVDGVYRLSGGSGLTQSLRAAFDAGGKPDLAAPTVGRDPHAVASLLKMYFRELPNPLCTYQLYESFVSAVQLPGEEAKLRAVRDAVVKLPPPHYRTLAYLMRHLRRVSLLGSLTGMTARNMAIVWAPNLLRSPHTQHALQGVAVQAVVTEFLICFAEELFAQEQGAECGLDSLEPRASSGGASVELRGSDSCRRPKSLPLHPPTKLLSLEEARRRGPVPPATSFSPGPLPPAPLAGAVSAGGAGGDRLRPQGDVKPKYIEVGSGPNNLPQYHTVLDLPLPGVKRGLKRSPSGWRGLFSRSKQQRPRARPAPAAPFTPPIVAPTEEPLVCALRPVKSCESLGSECDALGPLHDARPHTLKQHTRSSSCDSYFEPWQAELAGMRLRLSPQERDHHMFSEEDDTQLNLHQDESVGSTPPLSGLCSAEPSPRRCLRVDIEAATDLADRQRLALEEQLASIGYIDGESPRAKPPEKRASRPATPPLDVAKRLCKVRDSPMSSLTDVQTSISNVKLRDRSSPRKGKNPNRYSGIHPVLSDNVTINGGSRLSWHGKDGHSTLIKINWPIDHTVNSSSNLTSSTFNSSPLTPVTPVTPNYDILDTDSEAELRVKGKSDCSNCTDEKCLKCELKATDYENVRYSIEYSPVRDISYQNLNRLSAVSTSSNSDTDKKNSEAMKLMTCSHDSSSSHDVMKVMTSSHESSSSFSNASLKQGDDYENFKFTRPNYINLQSSSSKSSPGSPLKSPLKSTISITFRSPTKCRSPDYEPIDNETPINERDSVYEDIDLEKNLSIVEEATVPDLDASLPTPACQPDYNHDLIIFESPNENENDVYSQVEFFKKSIEEVNAMIVGSPEDKRHYENVDFVEQSHENIIEALQICDKVDERFSVKNADNGNVVKKNLNVRELAIRFESPTELKGPFVFEKFKAEIKYPSLERNHDKKEESNKESPKIPPVSPKTKTFKLSRNPSNARSLDENAFVKEFGDKTNVDRRKSLEVKDCKTKSKFLPDLNLNLEENETHKHQLKLESITPTTENKISLIQRFETKKPELKTLIGFETEKKLSRERIERYKEERRIFLREKYSSQSFRSNSEQLTRLKVRKEPDDIEKDIQSESFKESKFERRNTADLGQRMRFTIAKSANNLDNIQCPENLAAKQADSQNEVRNEARCSDFDRTEKVSPSYNIRDMAAMFELKSQGNAS